MLGTRHLEIVSKISKHCNLRCTYCYEYPELADRARMDIAAIRHMFDTLRRYADANPQLESIRFAWQGGEPMLIQPEVYEVIARACAEAFAGSPLAVSHVMQTNLTALSPKWLAFLRERRLFADLGVSLDVVGDCRVDIRGRSSTATVLRNMQVLIDAGVPFAAIAVLSQQLVERIGEVHGFFDDLRIESRLLPFNQSVSTAQFDAHALDMGAITAALCLVFDRWMASANATSVEPLREYLGYAISFLRGDHAVPDAARLDQCESVYVVHTNGLVWGTAELYLPGAAYGNIFREEFAEMLVAPPRQAAAARLRERVGRICGACPYYGACPGFAVAFGMPDERAAIEREGCGVRAVLDHIIARLNQAEIAEEICNSDLDTATAGAALATAL